MSQVVTPPDIVNEHTVFLIVNAPTWDVEMVVRWLKMSNKEYTIHLYHDGMDDLTWLRSAGEQSQTILIDRKNSDLKSVDALLDYVGKIKWFGEDQPSPSAVEYLVNNGWNAKRAPAGVLQLL